MVERLVFIHKKGGQYLMGVPSGDVVEAALVDKVDEVHGFLGKTVHHGPPLKIEVFSLYLFGQRGEEVLDGFLENVKLRQLGVFVFADDVLKLAPRHLFTVFVEQSAASLARLALLADETWLAA